MDQEKQKELHQRILAEAEDKRLPCRKAFDLAAELDCPVFAVGKACNEIGVKIENCQLGCF